MTVQIHQLSVAAAEIGQCPDGWRAYRYEVRDQRLGYVPDRYFVTGCVPDGTYTRGPRKGEPRYKRPLPGTVRTVTFTKAELDAWEKAWALRTGKCVVCGGSALELRSWNVETGPVHGPCRPCGGTGLSEAARAQQAGVQHG